MDPHTWKRMCSMLNGNRAEDRVRLGRRIVDHVAHPRFTDVSGPQSWDRTKVRDAHVRSAVFAGCEECHPFVLLYRAHIRLDVPEYLPLQLCEALRGTANFRRRMLVSYVLMGMMFDGFSVSAETCRRLQLM